MKINTCCVEFIEFENLREFIKTQDTPYILKYELDEEEAVYYGIGETSSFVLLAFCVDKNFKSEYIRIEGDKIVESKERSGVTLTLAKVAYDTFLEQVFNKYFKEEPKKK